MRLTMKERQPVIAVTQERYRKAGKKLKRQILDDCCRLTGYKRAYASHLRSLFDREVAAVERMIRGRRKSVGLVHDEWTEWVNYLEASGATIEELDDAFRHVEALDQYDEGGAIIRMFAHERAFACGRVDQEFTADDLPEQARLSSEKQRCRQIMRRSGSL